MSLKHQIARIETRFCFDNEDTYAACRQKVENACKETIPAVLEMLFDEFAGAGKWLRVTRVELDLGNIRANCLEKDVAERLKAELRFWLRSRLYDIRNEQEGLRERELEALSHFLQYGVWPWMAGSEEMPAPLALFKNLLKNCPERVIGLLRAHKDTPFQVRVLGLIADAGFHNISQDIKGEHVSLMLNSFVSVGTADHPGGDHDPAGDVPAMMERMKRTWGIGWGEQDIRFIERLIKAGKHRARPDSSPGGADLKKDNAKFLAGKDQQDLPEEGIPPLPDIPLLSPGLPFRLKNSEGEGIPATQSAPEIFYIANAGLVLLWPFLKDLFARCDLTEQSEFKTPEHRHRAVRLLHYLVFGQEEGQEPLCLLNKILCGVHWNDVLRRDMPALSEFEKDTTESLLQAVIAQWNKVGNTSLVGLRGSFLIREGKLSREEDCWRLNVEPKGYDVLMDYLPWSISIVQLPWMEKPLSVHWR